MPSTTMSFFTDMVQQIADRGRSLMGGRRLGEGSAEDLRRMAEELLSNRGEASSVARASELLECYASATIDARAGFLSALAQDFGPNETAIAEAMAAYSAQPGPRKAMALHLAAEPRRQELFRKLNRAPDGTLSLVRMREDVISLMKTHPPLADVDADFQHLFNSWFNRGFLTLRRIDWSSPASVLEKIIQYEAVHRIENFEDLKTRLAPEDRRLYAFFHPALVEEPLIFVEVALTSSVPGAIPHILATDRKPIPLRDATTAVFYSISNCQKGLAGVSFGNFLIKQVVEELRRDLPQLRTFVTLSPVPGFVDWIRAQLADFDSHFLDPEERVALERWFSQDISEPDPDEEAEDDQEESLSEALENSMREPIRSLAATYLVRAKSVSGTRGVERPKDPVARFHLGNGARLEHVHGLADMSPRGLAQSAGIMVNYLYDLDTIERNHEAYAERGEIAMSNEVKRLAKPQSAFREVAGGRGG
jgi:malonyl-CoA decarboxylase